MNPFMVAESELEHSTIFRGGGLATKTFDPIVQHATLIPTPPNQQILLILKSGKRCLMMNWIVIQQVIVIPTKTTMNQKISLIEAQQYQGEYLYSAGLIRTQVIGVDMQLLSAVSISKFRQINTGGKYLFTHYYLLQMKIIFCLQLPPLGTDRLRFQEAIQSPKPTSMMMAIVPKPKTLLSCTASSNDK